MTITHDDEPTTNPDDLYDEQCDTLWDLRPTGVEFSAMCATLHELRGSTPTDTKENRG